MRCHSDLMAFKVMFVGFHGYSMGFMVSDWVSMVFDTVSYWVSMVISWRYRFVMISTMAIEIVDLHLKSGVCWFTRG